MYGSIFYNDEMIETAELCIPHKHMHERLFVLLPLVEIAPDFIHPKYRKIDTNGTLSKISYVETLGGGRGIGYPQFELMEDKTLFVWTNPLEKNQIISRWIDL